MFALTPPSQWISHKHVNHPHLLFCLLLIVLSDGPGAEGRHKPHLRGTTDQDQAARHLLQRLPNPVQLRGTEHVRRTISSHRKHAGSCHFCTYALHIMHFFFSPFGYGMCWRTTSHFLALGHKGCCCRGLWSQLWPLWNLAKSSKE